MTGRNLDILQRANLSNLTLIYLCACLSLLVSPCHGFKNSEFRCDPSGPCRCSFPNGQGYDLSTVGESDARLNASIDNLTFYFHPCSDISLGNQSEGNDCFAGSSVCLFNRSSEKFENLGSANESSIFSPLGLNQPVFVYRHGGNVTRIQIECDTTGGSSLNVQSIFPEYALVLKSPAACLKWLAPLQQDPEDDIETHLSTGSILVIMFVVLTSLYFVGGALTLKFLRGAEGVEMIPNYEFWMSLPGLVKEGFLFAVSGCKTPQAYDRI